MSGVGPEPDRESVAFWDGLARHRVVLQECGACRRRRLPRMPACPYCSATDRQDVEAPGTGTIYSWVRVHRDLGSGSADRLPYTVVTVDLDGGGRVFGRLEPAESASIGALVDADFVSHGTWTELLFRPSAAGAAPGSRPFR